METIDGLPAHPLFVHLPVVLIPLAFIGAILVLAVAKWRRAAWVVTALVAIGFVGALLAENSGEALEENVDETELVEQHAAQGELVPLLSGLFFVTSAAVAGYELFGRRKVEGSASTTAADGPTDAAASGMSKAKMIGTALAAASVVAGGAATYSAYAAGHSGAKAVWQGEGSGEGREDGDAKERESKSSSDDGYERDESEEDEG